MQPLALFDLDDTLIDRRAAFHTWATEFVAAHDLDPVALAFLVMADAHHAGPMDDYFALVCATFSLAETPGRLWAQYRRRIPELVSCRREDLEALHRLRRAGWRIGIVTNGMADNQLGKIQNTGLDGLVDAWCISGEVGIRKPDPEIFRRAAERCGSSPDRGGWMVGDSLVLDVAGGRAAGLRTIWVHDRPGRESVPLAGPPPEFTVGTVAGAIEALLSADQD